MHSPTDIRPCHTASLTSRMSVLCATLKGMFSLYLQCSLTRAPRYTIYPNSVVAVRAQQMNSTCPLATLLAAHHAACPPGSSVHLALYRKPSDPAMWHPGPKADDYHTLQASEVLSRVTRENDPKTEDADTQTAGMLESAASARSAFISRLLQAILLPLSLTPFPRSHPGPPQTSRPPRRWSRKPSFRAPSSRGFPRTTTQATLRLRADTPPRPPSQGSGSDSGSHRSSREASRLRAHFEFAPSRCGESKIASCPLIHVRTVRTSMRTGQSRAGACVRCRRPLACGRSFQSSACSSRIHRHSCSMPCASLA